MHLYNLTGQFEEVKFQGACDDGYLISFQHLTWDGFACVDGVAEMVRCGKGHINKPNATTGLISLKIGVV